VNLGLLAEDLIHTGSAGSAFAFFGFAAVLHGYFLNVLHFFLGLAFNAISFFCHM
jgi:hypothetical protein